MDAQKQMHVFDRRLFLAGVGSLSLLGASSAAAQTTASGKELRQLLAQFVVAFDVRRVPADVIELARLAFIDSIGVAVAGSHEKVAHIAADIVRMEGATQQGMIVRPSPQAANYDPSVYHDPLRFDIHRHPKRIMTFGAGPHHCIGNALGRMTIQVAIRQLLARFPRARLAEPDFMPIYGGSTGELRMKSLPMMTH